MPPKTLLSDEPAVDVAATMVAAIDAVHDREAREQADARSRWRRNVAAAAAAEGKLPQSAVDEVLRDAATLGYSSDDFAADISAVMEDSRHAATIDAERQTIAQLSNEAETVREEIQRIQAEYLRVRAERDSLIRTMDKELTEKRRDLERREADIRRTASRLEHAQMEQMKSRNKASRQRVFG